MDKAIAVYDTGLTPYILCQSVLGQAYRIASNIDHPQQYAQLDEVINVEDMRTVDGANVILKGFNSDGSFTLRSEILVSDVQKAFEKANMDVPTIATPNVFRKSLELLKVHLNQL